ncbi:hypothetical protein DPMN_022096 [Dreissena polymorpha]|uniref:Uncharacterized protein n=1 Tax=Dreissena polymorpha TaxID=45954 RepID=A0A9D4SBJ2_DREPO|nr:hypothetical protein DPMN_022096 [Dreissena polymorpha]
MNIGHEIFELKRGIIRKNLLTKFHEDRTRNVASRVKTAPLAGGHVFQRTKTTFELNQDIIKTTILTNFELNRDIIKTNLLTKFHVYRTRNVASRVFTRKSAPPTGGHVFQRTGTTFDLNQDIIKTNILTNFELNRSIIGTNLLTKFHEDRTRNVASRVFTRKIAPPTGGHVFQQTGTIFQLNQDIIKTNILTNFKLDRDFIVTNPLTKFHEDRLRNVASRVFTNKSKNVMPTGGHGFQATETIFKLVQDIIGKNILNKLHDWTIHVASKPSTRKKGPAPWWACFSSNQNHFQNLTINVSSSVLTRQMLTTDKSIFRNLNAKCDGKTDRQTDRQTDIQTDGQSDHYMPPFLRKGA